MNDELLYDKRLLARHEKQGLLDRAAIEKHIADLPDLTDIAAKVSVELSSVGIANREAEDTGLLDDA